jgi:U3 small nucleolar RNA-associated protein 25
MVESKCLEILFMLQALLISLRGKKKDYDYLSSIEIVVVDQTDALLMQNWDHVTFVMQHLNLSPKEAHGCDFSRVRMWYLDDNAKHLRQTIVLSSFITPEINSLFSKYMMNVSGKIKYQANYDGSMLTTGLPLKQTFARYHSSNIQSDPDTRFKFFTSTVVPWMLRQPRPAEGGLGILIFIPSYFDFVRVKNYFQTSPTVSSLSFATVTENKSPAEPETRRARSHFLTGKSSVMLYTGRAHHFYRYMMKGVKSVVMYQLPDNPLFYREIVAGFLGASVTTGRISGEEGSVRAMFSKWDALRLERIVGTERLRTMLGAGDTFDFI